jgi:acetylornithine deacetylase/succinyl-diaminopimelate desuccinylase-like protein
MTEASIRERLSAHIAARRPQWLAELQALCRQPSISAQRVGLAETARLVADLLAQRGFAVEIIPTAGAPVVYAEAPGQSDRTLLFYNHYDVQPPDPLDRWTSPPFEPTLRGERLYARGAADDKGHIVSRLVALDTVRQLTGGYPWRMKFIIEGEEEIGSPHLPAFVARHRDRLQASACIWESGGANFAGQPILYCGMRGIVYVELHSRTADLDAHSGTGGSIFPNAAWRLTWALATIKGPDEQVRLPGFYDHVRPPTPRDLELLARLPDEDDLLLTTYGLCGFLGDRHGADLRRAQVFTPSCTICGLSAGYQGPGAKTVLPAEARAKVDFRLVPDQDPAAVIAALRRHLEAQGFGDIQVTVLGAEHPARVDPDHPFVQLAARTGEEIYGQPAAIWPLIGGSGPMYPFVHELGLPIATPGISYPQARIHAPDEHIRLSDFERGTAHLALLLLRLPSLA